MRIVLLLLCFALTACFDEVKEKPANPGVEATEDSVAEALMKALDGISIFDAEPDQYVEYEDNFRIETNAVIRRYATARRLLSKVDEGDATMFRMFQDWFEFDSTGEVVDETHTEVALAVPHEDVTAASWRMRRLATYGPRAADNVCDGQDVTDEEGRVYDCIKYFNLVYEERLVSPPAAVRNRNGCEGLPGCMMSVRYISYDEVKWRKGVVVHKLTLKAEIAPQVPDIFYGAQNGSISVLSLCLAGLIDIPEADRDYFVTQCKVLRDFRL